MVATRAWGKMGREVLTRVQMGGRVALAAVVVAEHRVKGPGVREEEEEEEV